MANTNADARHSISWHVCVAFAILSLISIYIPSFASRTSILAPVTSGLVTFKTALNVVRNVKILF